jgi:hypothetical protein
MRKFMKPIGLIVFGFFMALIGFFIAIYSVGILELNDRLKYEAAYVNGYSKVYFALKEGDPEKAQSIVSFYIDAHLLTLSDFDYLQSSGSWWDVKDRLCKIAEDRKTNVEVNNEEAKEKIIEFSESITKDCI